MNPYDQGHQAALEKYAILGSMALGAGLHLGANGAYKLFKGTNAGKHFQAGQMASGFNQAIQGQKINPVMRNVATYGVGPESLVSYDLGQQLGGQMAGLGKGDRYRQLKKLRKSVAMTTHLKNAPLVGEVVPAVNRILDGHQGLMDKLPQVPSNAKTTLGQRALSAGIGGAAALAEPHSLIHMGINATRDAVGRSSKGQQFMKDQMVTGFQKGMPGKVPEAAFDLAVSPAALDTRRIGAAAALEAKENPQALRRLGGSALGGALRIPTIRSQAEGFLDRFK